MDPGKLCCCVRCFCFPPRVLSSRAGRSQTAELTSLVTGTDPKPVKLQKAGKTVPSKVYCLSALKKNEINEQFHNVLFLVLCRVTS